MWTWAPQSFLYLKWQNPQIHFPKHPLKYPWKSVQGQENSSESTSCSCSGMFCMVQGDDDSEGKNKLLCHMKKINYTCKKRQIQVKQKERTREETDQEQVVVWPHWCDKRHNEWADLVPGNPMLLWVSLFLLFFSFLNLVTRRNLPLRLRLE